LPLGKGNKLIGKTLVDSKLRETTGASIVAISRSGKMLANPTPQTVLTKGDVIGMIGEDEQITKAKDILRSETASG
jgi:K+/H+ antiporter YhaU regulatory subunit KhtT